MPPWAALKIHHYQLKIWLFFSILIRERNLNVKSNRILVHLSPRFASRPSATRMSASQGCTLIRRSNHCRHVYLLTVCSVPSRSWGLAVTFDEQGIGISNAAQDAVFDLPIIVRPIFSDRTPITYSLVFSYLRLRIEPLHCVCPGLLISK